MKLEYLLLYVVIIALLLVAHVTLQSRPSGNCGPAAMGLTKEGDVKPIMIDNQGYVLRHEEQ